MVDGGPVAVSGAMVQYYDVGYTSRMKLSEAPLHSLSRKTKAQLSSMLNAIKILPSEEGYFRDWRGLAHCAKLKSEQITFLAEREDPTKELIENWEKQRMRANYPIFRPSSANSTDGMWWMTQTRASVSHFPLILSPINRCFVLPYSGRCCQLRGPV